MRLASAADAADFLFYDSQSQSYPNEMIELIQASEQSGPEHLLHTTLVEKN